MTLEEIQAYWLMKGTGRDDLAVDIEIRAIKFEGKKRKY